MSNKIIVEKGSLLDEVFKDNLSEYFFGEELRKLEIKSKAQDISMRKEYADKTFAFSCLLY